MPDDLGSDLGSDLGNDMGGVESVVVPGFAVGGRVERTGIALVHEGEYIVPQPGSEAVISPDGGGVVNYYFPVQIEVVGSLPAAEVARVADHVFSELDRELNTRI
ncbi:hypothetical protein [Actinophytocola sp.]|uniref:hypothetical protein n=1 Tax=Actinophytocola sp. TaxID=1872138 RepID=UPI002D3E0214|nr:hypothetical protein [Actinophytocola sp.]HYQ62568.1 hypothetical protein [Actinophytocola sp.]